MKIFLVLLTAAFFVGCQRITTDTAGGGAQKEKVQYDETQNHPNPNK